MELCCGVSVLFIACEFVPFIFSPIFRSRLVFFVCVCVDYLFCSSWPLLFICNVAVFCCFCFVFSVDPFSSQRFLAAVIVINVLLQCNNCFFILLYFHLATSEACCALKKSLYASTYIQVTCIYKCVYHDLKYECLQIQMGYFCQ